MDRLHSSHHTFGRITGTEGPRHDPYSFQEITVYGSGLVVRVHRGLASWVTVDHVDTGARDRLDFSSDASDHNMREFFKDHTGFDLPVVERSFAGYEAARWRRMTPQQRYEDRMAEEFDDRMLSYAR